MLAPAGSPESFRAAIAAGADAVYLSGKRFGARKFAANFSDAEIEDSVRFAHARGVRVYVTVNTLIHDKEIAGTVDYLIWLYSIGVDAVLIQDIGIAALAREIIPELVIHASTQLTIYDAEGVKWASEQGFSRVVLARELSLAEVERIAHDTRDTGIGLEVFAHGALCYGYSGQCLLSSVIGGRSGNRGMCAQPCRKPYTLVTSPTDTFGRPTQVQPIALKEHYLLSPRDLCTYRHLPALVASPVASLKIEGRMKSPEYVAVVVSAYRRALDAIAAGAPPPPDEMDNLLLAFNRGFTSGYLFGDKHWSLMGRDAPDNRGLYLGKVSRYDAKTRTASIKTDGKKIPKTGDGLFFIEPGRPEQQFGFSLNTVPLEVRGEIQIPVPQPVNPGTKAYITSSVTLTAHARQIISHPSAALRHPVPLDLTIRVDDEGRLELKGHIQQEDGREISLSHIPDFTLVPAQSRPLTTEILEQQMKKSGGTPFIIGSVKMQYNGNFFAPLAELNRARREFLSHAESALIAASSPSMEKVEQAKSRWQLRAGEYPAVSESSLVEPKKPLRLAVYVDSLDAVRSAAESGCDRVYLEPAIPVIKKFSCRSHSHPEEVKEQIAAAVEICRAHSIPLIVKFPHITRTAFSDTVLPEVPHISGIGIAGFMAENPGIIHALRTLAPQCRIYGSTGLNVFNHATAKKLSSDCHLLTLSSELSRDECRDLVSAFHKQAHTLSFALIVQGISEALITDDCVLEPSLHCRSGHQNSEGVFYGLRDVTGHIFPVRTDSECRTHIGNAAELCLVDHLHEIRDMGITEAVIDARGRTGDYISEIIRIYRDAREIITAKKPGGEKHLLPLKDRIKKISMGEITAGHFLRGLKES